MGATVQTSWGMTELSPLGTIAPPDAAAGEARASGRPPMGLDLKLTDADGLRLSQQRGVVGHLKVKGASVIERYFKAETSALDSEGYFETGDLASIDDAGNVSICGRSKDLIKSGGEWINPAEIEDIVGAHPAVGLAAVIARSDAKWGERPVLIVEWRQGKSVDARRARSSCFAARLPTGGFPSRSSRSTRCRWPPPERSTRTNCVPSYANGRLEAGLKQSN